MNIMLTDITALNPEQAEVSMVTKSDADSFAGLFSQQLPQTPEKEGQGVDFKDFLEKIPMQTEASEITPELPLVAAKGEVPLPDPGKFSWDSSAGVIAPSGPVDNLVKQILKPDSNDMPNTPVGREKGEMLPIGGNLLPDDAGLEIAKQGVIEKTAAPVVTAAVGAETIRSASSEVLPASPSPFTRAPAVAPPADKVATLQGSSTGVVEKGAAATDFVAVMGKSSASESGQVIARDKVVTPESAQNMKPDLSPEARLVTESGLAGKMRSPELVPAPPSPRPVEAAGLTLPPAISAVAPPVTDRSILADPVRKGLNQNTSRDVASAPVATTDKVLLAAERILPVADTLSVRDMPNTPEYRNLDIPLQPAAGTSQQNTALSTSAVQTFSALSPPMASTTQAGAFPTHLETLTLARNADSTELGSGLSERVNWMINQKQNTATIRLDPPMLGKLDVQIKIADDATTVVFQTQHAQTRELIESASVRLRDFLQESGYQNVNVDVSQRQDQQQARQQTSLDPEADQQDEAQQEPDFANQQRDAASYFIGDGIVDTFA